MSNNIVTKGSRNDKFPNLGRRDARLARRGNAGIFDIFQVFATRLDGMDRRSKTGSYRCASPKAQWEKPAPGIHCRSISLPGGYAYSSMWGGEVSGFSCLSVDWRWGWFAGLSSRGLRYARRWAIGVDGGVGVSGLMILSVPMSACLNLQIFRVYIGSFVNILGRMISRERPGVLTVWLLSAWLCENQPVITGLY